MTIRITPRARQYAKEHGLHLASITLNGRHLKQSSRAMSGAVPDEIKRKIERLLEDWISAIDERNNKK